MAKNLLLFQNHKNGKLESDCKAFGQSIGIWRVCCDQFSWNTSSLNIV